MMSRIRENWEILLELFIIVTLAAFSTQLIAPLRMGEPDFTNFMQVPINATGQAFQTISTNLGTLATVVGISVGVVGIAGAVVKLLDWLAWRRKYGQSRTPTVALPGLRQGEAD